MAIKAVCAIVSFLLLHQAGAHDVEKVREPVETIGVLLHKTMRATSLFRFPRESRDESEQNSGYSPEYDKFHYSLGPIGACTRPAIAHCSFSSSVTIPEYYARLLITMKLYAKYRFTMNVDSTCADSLMSIVCSYAVITQCQSGTQVKFVVPDFETVVKVCVQGVSKCPNSGALESAICSSTSDLAKEMQRVIKRTENLQGKSFELTKCRVPSISACSNLLPSPDYLAAAKEAAFGSSLPASLYIMTGGNEECKKKLNQFLCAFPTCNANQTTVIGHKTRASCNDAFSCILSSKRNALSKFLHCSDFFGLDKPSPHYEPNKPKPSPNYEPTKPKPSPNYEPTKPKPSPSHGGSLAWWARLCIFGGCVLSVLLLGGVILKARKRARRRRLERYQEMESTIHCLSA